MKTILRIHLIALLFLAFTTAVMADVVPPTQTDNTFISVKALIKNIRKKVDPNCPPCPPNTMCAPCAVQITYVDIQVIEGDLPAGKLLTVENITEPLNLKIGSIYVMKLKSNSVGASYTLESYA